MTRFALLSTRTARLVLLAMLALVVWGWVVSPHLPTWSFGPNAGANDLEFYACVVEQVCQGNGYYPSFKHCFTKFAFQINSVFNCRLPTCAWVIGHGPDPEFFYWLLLGLTLLAVGVTMRTFVLPWAGRARTIIAALLLMGGAFSWLLYEHDAFMATEPWCEVFLLFSLCSYAANRWPLGMIFALLALALRELFVPYCLVAAALALWQRRWLETVLWAIALSAAYVLFRVHAAEVLRLYPDFHGSTSVDYWFHPTGLRFVLQSCVMNVFLRTLPNWMIAIYFPVALAGLIGWRGEIGARLLFSALAYITVFSFVMAGEYWGYMYTSILVLGLIRSPEAVRDLWLAAFSHPPRPNGLGQPKQ